jgi:uncharacterized protein
MPASASVVLYDAQGAPLVMDGGERGERETHADRWENYRTGIGTPGDKTTAGRFMPVWRLYDQELTSLFNGSALAAKIVEKRPKEMFRCGFDLEADGLEASAIEDLRDHATETLRLEDQMRETAIWGRLYGGALLLLGADDGGQPWEPLDETRIRTFEYINQVDRRYAQPETYYTDTLSPKCGHPETYRVSDAAFGLRSGAGTGKKSARDIRKSGGSSQLVHETRCIRFDGNLADVETRQQLIGWSWPVLQRIYDTMRAFDHAFDSAGYLLSDASQAVFKLQGLLSAISAGRRQEVAARVALLEETRSVARAVLLDAAANETFERVPTSFAGVSDLLDRWMLRFAADADMPATELFGRAPAGMNATGESDTRKWYDTIGSDQTNQLAPRLKRVFRLICLSNDSPVGKKDVKFKVVFKPLWSPTDAEAAQTNLQVAQMDVAYIGEGVVTAEEVALDRANLYPSLDVEAREKAMKGAESFDPYENDPEPEPPPAPGTPGAPPGAPGAQGKPPAAVKGDASHADGDLTKYARANKATRAVVTKHSLANTSAQHLKAAKDYAKLAHAYGSLGLTEEAQAFTSLVNTHAAKATEKAKSPSDHAAAAEAHTLSAALAGDDPPLAHAHERVAASHMAKAAAAGGAAGDEPRNEHGEWSKDGKRDKGDARIRLDAGHKVQALVFTKGHFTRETARAYCAANGHGCASVRETAKTYRVRQAAPDAFREASFKTLELAPGVRAIVGRARR